MYCLAPYVPHQHWPKLWDTAEIINNLRKSRIPGSHITRWEEFTQERPNYKTMVILPIGIPIKYFVPTESRNNSFVFHSRLGMYIGPDLLSPGSITIWNPDTKRFIRQNTYRILSYQQAPYEWKPLDPFTTVRTPKIYDKHNTLVANVEEEDTEKLNSPIFKEAIPLPNSLYVPPVNKRTHKRDCVVNPPSRTVPLPPRDNTVHDDYVPPDTPASDKTLRNTLCDDNAKNDNSTSVVVNSTSETSESNTPPMPTDHTVNVQSLSLIHI